MTVEHARSLFKTSEALMQNSSSNEGEDDSDGEAQILRDEAKVYLLRRNEGAREFRNKEAYDRWAPIFWRWRCIAIELFLKIFPRSEPCLKVFHVVLGGFSKLSVKLEHLRSKKCATLAIGVVTDGKYYPSHKSPTSNIPFEPRLDNTLIALFINFDLDVFTLDKSIRLYELRSHSRFRHDNLAPFLMHAINCTPGLVKLPAR